LRRPIGLGCISTDVTCLASMPRVHQDHGDTGESCFVSDIPSQLRKGPVGVSWPLLASGFNPLTHPRQLFQGNGSRGALRRFHETLCNPMICVLLKPGLLPGKAP